MTIPSLEPIPSRRNKSTFSAYLDALLAKLPAWGVAVDAVAAQATADAVTAADAAVTAAAAAASAQATTGVTKWVSGTTYTEGDGVWSPVNFITYRRKSTGGGTTDPSLDSANWAQIGVSAGANTFTGTQTMPAVKITTGAGAGKVLNSDAEGNGTWEDPTDVSQEMDALRANIMLQSFRLAVVGSLSVQKMIDGMVDEYEDQTGVDDPNSLGVTYNAVDDYYTTDASYTATGGSGNRTAIITVTTTLTITAGTIDNLVDGAIAANSSDAVQWTYRSDITGYYIRFDFGAGNAKVITEATMKAVSPESTTRGYWKWQGSNDATGWTDVSTSQQLAATQNNVFPFTNTTAYRYYQMIGVSGGLDCAGGMGNAWCEMEFKIGTSGAKCLLSDPTTAIDVPSTALFVLWQENIAVPTLNVDLQAWLSREAGVTFTTNFAASTTILNSVSHGFLNGDRVMVTASAQVLPTGLSYAIVYYVVEKTADSFKLSLTSGGAAVTFSSNGSGTLTARRWSQGTLAVETTHETTGRILVGSATLGNQATGTAIRYVLITPTGTAVRFHGASILWR